MSAPFHVIARERRATTLDEHTIDSMWLLFSRYYDDVDRAGFLRDLRAKDDIILLLDRERGTLAGFSTLQSYTRIVDGRSVVVVFSGDTICDERYWGQRALHSAFLRYVLRVKLANPFTPVYWFLISKGYKTYLLLARNFPEYWPRHDRPTPPWPGKLLDALASEKYGTAWIPEQGILHFAEPQGRLRRAVAPIGAAERSDDHIRFFDDRNPRAADGDELCCLGRIGVGLAANYAWRRVLRVFRVHSPATERRGSAIPTGAAR